MLGSRAASRWKVITTGSVAIDNALGAGGFPRGRVIEVFGPESSGKTTLALHVIAEAQKAGGDAAFIDAEHALDPTYARKLGVDVDKPDRLAAGLWRTGARNRAGACQFAGPVDVIVIDSVAALTPKAEIEGEMGDNHMGLHARMMSQALRKLTASVSKSKYLPGFHQSSSREDRSHVWEPRDDHGRQSAEVFCFGSHGSAAYDGDQRRRE